MDVNAIINLGTEMNLGYHTMRGAAGGVRPQMAVLWPFQFDSRMAVLIRDPKRESNIIAARVISRVN